MREREGDQPLPIEGQQNVSEAVKADLDERIALGIQRYGHPLQTFNGRDALRDAYEEALDLVHYLKQALMERDVAYEACELLSEAVHNGVSGDGRLLEAVAIADFVTGQRVDKADKV